MQVLSKDEQTYLEVNADKILKERGISKVTFAAAMGVKAQNFNKLVGTKNIVTLSQMGNYLNSPLHVLIFGKEEKEREIRGCVFVDGKANLIESKEDIENLLKRLE